VSFELKEIDCNVVVLHIGNVLLVIFREVAPDIFDNLPYNVRSAETIGTFHDRLKIHLFPVTAS